VKVDQSWSRGKPPADMMTALGLTDLDDCLLTEKSYYADGALAIYVRDVMPWSQITQELPETLDASLFEFTQRYTSTPIDHAVAELVPVVKRSDKTTQIGVKRGGVFLRLLETHYLKVGEPVAYSLIDIDDAYVRLEIFRRR
jgi:DNA-binding GntR family transcriptional regulator